MNLKNLYIVLFLFITLMFVGCYTKLGYYDSAYLKEKRQEQVETDKENVRDAKKHVRTVDLEDTADSDAETEGYYGRRKLSYSSGYSDTDGYHWMPYAYFPYAYYPSVYYPHPFYYGYYGYHAPYYRYYRSYYPTSGYYYGWSGRSSYPQDYRRTGKKGAVRRVHRSDNRRSRYSRGVTSSHPKSDRPQQRQKNRDKD